MDSVRPDTYGMNLLQMCKASSMRILNGRALGDSTGKYTCHQPGGSSVVDYGIVEDELFHKINYLRVHEYQPELSDHCQLSTQIKTWYKFTDTKLTLKNMPPKYTWNNESNQMFSLALHAPNSQEKIDSFLNNQPNK